MRIGDIWSYRNEPERLRRLIEAYWRVLLGTAGILIACAVLYGSFNLLSAFARGKGELTLSPGGATVTLNRVVLQEALNGFTARETYYEFLKKNPPKITDPSL